MHFRIEVVSYNVWNFATTNLIVMYEYECTQIMTDFRVEILHYHRQKYYSAVGITHRPLDLLYFLSFLVLLL